MKYLKKNSWALSVPQKIAIFIFLIVLLGFEMLLTFQKSSNLISTNHIDSAYYQKLEAELETVLQEKKSFQKSSLQSKFKQDSISPFNPNELPKQGWEKLGFTPKQAEVIMKYKQMLGGKFESKEQIKKCFVVSDEVYEILEPKILLPEKSKSDYKIEKSQTAKKVNYTRFNPNQFEEKDWIKIGFTPKQAEVILKYKRIVGGEFKSKEQLKKCFVISDEKFAEMQSYIDLPEKLESTFVKKESEQKEVIEPISTTKSNVSKVVISEKFNPNELDLQGWMNLGFSEKQAQTILNFKKSLGGKFKDAKTLSRSYAITEDKFKEMEPYLVFD